MAGFGPVRLRKAVFLLASLGFLGSGGLAGAQTVTVSKTSPADYSVIQEALEALGPGGGLDDGDTGNNVVQILDDSLYQEALSIDGFGVTIESTGPLRPRITASAADANANANNFMIRFDSDDLCVLRGLIIMPAVGSQPDGCITFDEFSGDPGEAYDAVLEDVLITANDGSNQPYSVDGTTAPDGTELRFGGDVLDFNSTPAGAAPSVVLRQTVMASASGGAGSLVRFFLDQGSVSIEQGCVFSYSVGHGLQFVSAEDTAATFLGTAADPIVVHGCEGGGIFSNSSTTRAVSQMDFVAVTRNSLGRQDAAVRCQYNGPETNVWKNVTLAGNSVREGASPLDGPFRVSAPLELENCIIAGDGGEGVIGPRNLGQVDGGHAISADGVCIDTSHGPTSLNAMWQRENGEAEDGILGADPQEAGAGVASLSPDFISLDPAHPAYLRVTNVELEFLGPLDGALSGAGNFAPLASVPMRTDSGDFQSYCEGIDVPSSGSADKYSQPNSDDLLVFSAAVLNVLEGELQAASNLAALISYDLVFYEDTAGEGFYATLEESAPGAGGWRGFYWFDLSPGRKVVMESPHPLFDGTRVEAIDVALGTDALAFMQSGTHRNNSPLLTPCDGTQSNGDPYRLSDMAHNADSYFQMAHNVLHNFHEHAVSVSVHGMAESSDPSDVVISNGTGTEIPGSSLSRDIADLMNVLLNSDPRYAVSHQEPGESPALSGSTNTQGRYSNGAANPCGLPGFVVSPERFIHMEQDPDVRGAPSSNWDFVIETYNTLIGEFPGAAAVPKEDGSLVSEFPLDGDAASATGQQPGALSGAAAPAEDRFSTPDAALSLEGAGHAEIPDYRYDGPDTEFTLSLWFRVNAEGGGGDQYLFSHGSIGRDGEVSLPDSLHAYLFRDTGELRIRLTVADGTHWSYAGPSGLNDDEWHFLTLTYSQTEGATIYVDGAEEGSLANVALRSFDPETAIVLGGRSDREPGRFLGENPGETGFLDTFRIHNTALSPGEITDLFNETGGTTGLDFWQIL